MSKNLSRYLVRGFSHLIQPATICLTEPNRLRNYPSKKNQPFASTKSEAQQAWKTTGRNEPKHGKMNDNRWENVWWDVVIPQGSLLDPAPDPVLNGGILTPIHGRKQMGNWGEKNTICRGLELHL